MEGSFMNGGFMVEVEGGGGIKKKSCWGSLGPGSWKKI